MNSLSDLRLASFLHVLEQYLVAGVFGVNGVLHVAQVLLAVPLLGLFCCLRRLASAVFWHFFVQYAASGWCGVNALPHPAHCFCVRGVGLFFVRRYLALSLHVEVQYLALGCRDVNSVPHCSHALGL